MDWVTIIFYIGIIGLLASTRSWKEFGLFAGGYLIFHMILGLVVFPERGEMFGEWISQAGIIIGAGAGARSGWKGREGSDFECPKCGRGVDGIDDLVPETGELVCPKCDYRFKKPKDN